MKKVDTPSAAEIAEFDELYDYIVRQTEKSDEFLDLQFLCIAFENDEKLDAMAAMKKRLDVYIDPNDIDAFNKKVKLHYILRIPVEGTFKIQLVAMKAKFNSFGLIEEFVSKKTDFVLGEPNCRNMYKFLEAESVNYQESLSNVQLIKRYIEWRKLNEIGPVDEHCVLKRLRQVRNELSSGKEEIPIEIHVRLMMFLGVPLVNSQVGKKIAKIGNIRADKFHRIVTFFPYNWIPNVEPLSKKYNIELVYEEDPVDPILMYDPQRPSASTSAERVPYVPTFKRVVTKRSREAAKARKEIKKLPDYPLNSVLEHKNLIAQSPSPPAPHQAHPWIRPPPHKFKKMSPVPNGSNLSQYIGANNSEPSSPPPPYQGFIHGSRKTKVPDEKPEEAMEVDTSESRACHEPTPPTMSRSPSVTSSSSTDCRTLQKALLRACRNMRSPSFADMESSILKAMDDTDDLCQIDDYELANCLKLAIDMVTTKSSKSGIENGYIPFSKLSRVLHTFIHPFQSPEFDEIKEQLKETFKDAVNTDDKVGIEFALAAFKAILMTCMP